MGCRKIPRDPQKLQKNRDKFNGNQWIKHEEGLCLEANLRTQRMSIWFQWIGGMCRVMASPKFDELTSPATGLEEMEIRGI